MDNKTKAIEELKAMLASCPIAIEWNPKDVFGMFYLTIERINHNKKMIEKIVEILEEKS
jgi:hypothetical protein